MSLVNEVGNPDNEFAEFCGQVLCDERQAHEWSDSQLEEFESIIHMRLDIPATSTVDRRAFNEIILPAIREVQKHRAEQ
jgi:hypothetical protein